MGDDVSAAAVYNSSTLCLEENHMRFKEKQWKLTSLVACAG